MPKQKKCPIVKQLKTKQKMKNLLMTAIAIFGFAIITLAQLPSYVPTNGLVGYWPFNGNANDLSVNNLNANVLGGATLTTDRSSNVNASYDFDYSTVSFGGQTDEVYIPFNPLLNVDFITVSVWLYPRSYYWTGDSGNPNSIILNRFEYGYSTPNGEAWGVAFNQNSVTGFILGSTGASAISNTPLNLNVWHHILMTYDGANIKLYVDGSLSGIQNHTAAMNIAGNSGISIGESNQANGYWNQTDGKIDDIGIWNRSLTPCEIQALYQSGTSSMTVNATASTICSGLSTTLTASGATTYSWMPGSLSGNSVVVTPSTTTTYTITGTDGSGCTSSTTALVNVSISPSTATSQTNISCNGGSNGSATIAVSGGAPGYSYLWNNGQITATLSGLTAGTYTCTVTDANSCSTITAVTLSEPAAIAGIQSPAICVGDNYPVGSSTYTAAGTYTDILTATNGCDSTVTTNLTVNPLPSLAVAATDTNVCVYSSAVSLIAIPTGGTWSGAGINGSTFSPAIAGAGTTVITYAYSDGNACSNTANIAMLVDLCTGINKFKNNTSFTVYPNPVSDELIIEFQGNKNNTGFEIVNPIGQVIFNGNLLEKTVVQTSNFAPGVYLIKLKNGKSYEFKKIVKE